MPTPPNTPCRHVIRAALEAPGAIVRAASRGLALVCAPWTRRVSFVIASILVAPIAESGSFQGNIFGWASSSQGHTVSLDLPSGRVAVKPCDGSPLQVLFLQDTSGGWTFDTSLLAAKPICKVGFAHTGPVGVLVDGVHVMDVELSPVGLTIPPTTPAALQSATLWLGSPAAAAYVLSVYENPTQAQIVQAEALLSDLSITGI